MKKIFRYIVIVLLISISGILLAIPAAYEFNTAESFYLPDPPDSTLKFPIKKDIGIDPLYKGSSLYLNDPSNFKTVFEYDPLTNQYVSKKKIGNSIDYFNPYYFNLKEYQQFDTKKNLNSYWKERSAVTGKDEREGLIPTINIRNEAFDRIFGSSTIDVRPQGSIDLKLGVLHNFRNDPNLNIRQRKSTNFDVDMNMQINVMAKIGEKIKLDFNMDSRAMSFTVDNENKLRYEGNEDEIIKSIEAGNVTMPINSKLIQGSQALFGAKAKLQFGKLSVTGVIAEQNSTSSTVTAAGGKQNTEFKVKITDYDENRHFFISQYFRDNYEKGMSTLPIISSNINITKIEVWVTNIGSAVTDNRNIVAFSDLGEHNPYNQFVFPADNYSFPDNKRNTLMQMMDTTKIRNINTVYSYLSSLPGADFVQGRDFEKVESARKLTQTEYTFNRTLGFISLSNALNPGQVLAVAFQYTVNNEIYQVGEFSDQGIMNPNCLVVKLLRSTTVDTHFPMWNLMMKNVYSLNSYQVSREGFVLNILYTGNENGVPTGYFKEGPSNIKGIALIKLLGLDTLDANQNPIAGGDGIFDFIDNAATNGGTIQSSNGKIFFPVLEPFGSYLRKILPANLANKCAFDSLYTTTKTKAKQMTEKDKFIISGYYSASGGAEISLNAFNVPQGSVSVTAGGRTLIENVDYTVDYVFGMVTIINEGILNSGATISVSTESQSFTGLQKQSLMGVRADYLYSKNLNFGATFMHLREKPISKKVAYGNEPIANSIWGMDVQYQKEAPFITKAIDFLPLISTNAPSTIYADAEFAQFIPGHPNAIGTSGNSYIDDFESSKQSISLAAPGFWFLASTPSYFPEASSGTLSYGFRRSKLAWYVIDPTFYQPSYMPPNITLAEVSNHYVRRVEQKELFPQAEAANNQVYTLPVFNLAYYPSERGPYNYNVDELKEDGKLENPQDKWGGIMRKMESSDFEANNIEYIEFWLMDPFMDPDDDGPITQYNTSGGKLVFNLGDISEDILKDGRKSFENGLPTSANVVDVDTTIWGRVPSIQALVYAFDSDPASRPYQDLGYDGLNSTREGNNDEYSFFYDSYIKKIYDKFGNNSTLAYQNAVKDPSGDDFQYFRGSNYDSDDEYTSILRRYKNYNGPEGNSCAQELSPESYDISASTYPNMEDINNDNTLNESENFYEYIVDLSPNNMVIGQNYITDIYEANNIQLQNGTRSSTKWYQFKIPISQPDNIHGVINDFTSINFMRMFLTEFKENVVLRFGTLELVKGDWRRFQGDLLAPGEYIPTNSVNTTNFDVFTVSLEENGGSTERVPYVIPQGIIREVNYATTNQAKQNEQSMAITVTNLYDGDARAAYKISNFDFRNYKNLEMFVHAHAASQMDNQKYANTTGAVTLFVRFGPDLTENYYEYEIPLTITPWGTSAGNKEAIWIESNMLNISFEKLIEAKNHRKQDIYDGVPGVSMLLPYSEQDGNNKITVMGTPSISTVNAILIGVRNPKQTSLSINDDGLPISMTVWVNELRLSNFNEKSGWAATASLSANLADLGNIAVSGLYTTPGFGNIGTNVNERTQKTVFNIYTSVNLEVGKIFPKSTGIRIPVHFDYSEETSTPEYDPLEPDVYTKNQLALMDRGERSEYKAKIQELTKKTNINVMNVRKDRTSTTKKPHFWDIENFDASYSYSKTEQSDIDIDYYNKFIHTAGLGYSFSANPKNIKPFSKTKSKTLKNKNLALIRDFNFYYQPRSFAFRTNMDKTYIERLIRNKTNDDIIINPTVSKQWLWNRMYSFKHDFSSALKFDYASTVSSYIDEPSGLILDKKAYNDVVWGSVKNFGRINNFNQTFGVQWTVPINKIPLLTWINLTTNYDATLRWNASAVSIQSKMGNTIENSSNVNGHITFRMSTLFGYIPYVKDAIKSTPKKIQPPKPAKPNPNDTTKVEKPRINYGKIIGDGTIKIIFGLKDISISMQKTGGTILPGYLPEPDNFGFTWKTKAPTWGFILGSQEDIRHKASNNKWISTDTLMNNRYGKNNTTNINYRANYEPFNGFKIEITGTYRKSETYSELYKADALGFFADQGYAPMFGGSYEVSYIFIKSSFEKAVVTQTNEGKQNNISSTFETLKQYRNTIAKRYASQNPNYDGRSFYDTISGTSFPLGYGPGQQEVILTALIAAYAGINPNSIALSPFPKIPLPNWNFQYNGLSKIEFLKPIFKNISLKHTYRSAYNVANYTNNVYFEETNGFPSAYDDAFNFIASNQVANVQITEQFAPLVGIDFTMQNSLMGNVQIKKSRTLGMSFANNQLTDNSSNEWVFGLGYRFKDVKFTVRTLGGNGKTTNIKSDINVKVDFSVRNNITILRRIDEKVNQISSGQKIYSINGSADYMISKNLTVALYYEQTINKPHLESSIPNSTLRAGISLRMSLAQ